MSLLKHPSVKLLVKYILQNCEIANENEIQDPTTSSNKPNLQTWTCNIPQGSFDFSVVWIQGNILEVEAFGKSAIISDGTGKIVLAACDKVTAKTEIKKGMYMMAIGTLTGNPGSQEMKPFKLQNLSHLDYVQDAWHLEVVDQIHHLTRQVKLASS